MPDTNEQIKEWEPMIFYVIRQLHLHPNEVDDAAQTARIALWRALQDGKTLGKTYCFIRIRGAILNERAKQAKTLQHEVASERLPEQVDQREVPLSLWLDDKRSTLPNRHFTLLCHMLHGTEASLGYSPSRLRAIRPNCNGCSVRTTSKRRQEDDLTHERRRRPAHPLFTHDRKIGQHGQPGDL